MSKTALYTLDTIFSAFAEAGDGAEIERTCKQSFSNYMKAKVNLGVPQNKTFWRENLQAWQELVSQNLGEDFDTDIKLFGTLFRKALNSTKPDADNKPKRKFYRAPTRQP
jgi:hypothetical protein